MSHELAHLEDLGLPELHPDVVELDGQIVHSLDQEQDDAQKEQLEALIERRNAAFRANHPAYVEESADTPG
jgi:hypothetical protein